MAHYVWNEGATQGAALRALLTHLDQVIHGAALLQGVLNQMTTAQVQTTFGFADGVNSPDAATAAAAKAELLSDLGKLLTDAQQTGVNSALNQLMAEFG